LLFSNQFGDLHIIHDINGFVPTKIFSGDMLKDEIFVEIWQETCASDYKNYVEKFNHLFYGLDAVKDVIQNNEGEINVRMKTVSYETADMSDSNLNIYSGDNSLSSMSDD
jgi:hypothetical protein